jgi:hypothetical protein
VTCTILPLYATPDDNSQHSQEESQKVCQADYKNKTKKYNTSQTFFKPFINSISVVSLCIISKSQTTVSLAVIRINLDRSKTILDCLCIFVNLSISSCPELYLKKLKKCHKRNSISQINRSLRYSEPDNCPLQKLLNMNIHRFAHTRKRKIHFVEWEKTREAILKCLFI